MEPSITTDLVSKPSIFNQRRKVQIKYPAKMKIPIWTIWAKFSRKNSIISKSRRNETDSAEILIILETYEEYMNRLNSTIKNILNLSILYKVKKWKMQLKIIRNNLKSYVLLIQIWPSITKSAAQESIIMKFKNWPNRYSKWLKISLQFEIKALWLKKYWAQAKPNMAAIPKKVKKWQFQNSNRENQLIIPTQFQETQTFHTQLAIQQKNACLRLSTASRIP